MPIKKVPKVFLDANIVIQAGKPPGSAILARVAQLAEAGLIEILTTDLTISEVAKKHTANDFGVIKDFGRPHFRKILEEALGVALPNTSKSELQEVLSKKYKEATSLMFKRLGAKILSIDDVKPSFVFNSYSQGTGFFSGEGKKDQFPDAFIFECLKPQASNETPVIIVSDDGDFVGSAKVEKDISLVKSLSSLFQHLGLQVEEPNLNNFLQANHMQLIKAVDSELGNWGLHVSDVMDAEIDATTVLDVVIKEIISFGAAEKGEPILVVGKITVTANVEFTHPNWAEAMYDSEEKRLIPFEDVNGETEVSFDVDFSMSIALNQHGLPNEIEELRFQDDDFQWVNIDPYDPYG